jgi:hypothetical protein
MCSRSVQDPFEIRLTPQAARTNESHFTTSPGLIIFFVEPSPAGCAWGANPLHPEFVGEPSSLPLSMYQLMTNSSAYLSLPARAALSLPRRLRAGSLSGTGHLFTVVYRFQKLFFEVV